MKRLRIRVIVLASWLIIFYLIGGLLDPVALNPITIGLLLVLVIVALVIPNVPKMTLLAIMLVPITALLVTKFWISTLLGELTIYMTIIEVSALAVTIILARWVGLALNDFEKEVGKITLGQRGKKLRAAVLEQGLIYREVRRARNHQRPLALIAVSVDKNSINPSDEKMVQEIQRTMLEQYKLRVLSNMLCAELEDCAVIVQDTDYYLAVLPETLPDESKVLVARLRQKAFEEIGIELKVGVATLPHDSYTYEGLVEMATREMKKDREAQPYLILEEQPLENRLKD